ncbi:hypothetical protein D3C81_1806580 [compost metagenome]
MRTSNEFGSSMSGRSELNAATAITGIVISWAIKLITDRVTPVLIIKWDLPIIVKPLLSKMQKQEQMCGYRSISRPGFFVYIKR